MPGDAGGGGAVYCCELDGATLRAVCGAQRFEGSAEEFAAELVAGLGRTDSAAAPFAELDAEHPLRLCIIVSGAVVLELPLVRRDELPARSLALALLEVYAAPAPAASGSGGGGGDGGAAVLAAAPKRRLQASSPVASTKPAQPPQPPQPPPPQPPPQQPPRIIIAHDTVEGLRIAYGYISTDLERALFEGALFRESLPRTGESLSAYLSRTVPAARRGVARISGNDEVSPEDVPGLMAALSAAIADGLVGDDMPVVRPETLHSLLYAPGGSMMQHADSWFSYGGVILGVSLGADCCLVMSRQQQEVRQVLARGTIYALTGAARRGEVDERTGAISSCWLHAIDSIDDRHSADPLWNRLRLRASITLRSMRTYEREALRLSHERAVGDAPLRRALLEQQRRNEADGEERCEFWPRTALSPAAAAAAAAAGQPQMKWATGEAADHELARGKIRAGLSAAGERAKAVALLGKLGGGGELYMMRRSPPPPPSRFA